MTEQVPNSKLKFLTSYWCSQVSEKNKDRFDWSMERADRARSILVALAKTTPNDFCASHFAAGPLENYINLIVQEKRVDEAAFIAGNPYLKLLLGYVWGDIEQLVPLANQNKSGIGRYEEPQPEKVLKAINIKDLMAFWCHTCVSSLVTKYERQYNLVLKQLLNKNTRENVMHDLLASAPDDQAVRYLKENIFILQKWQE